MLIFQVAQAFAQVEVPVMSPKTPAIVALPSLTDIQNWLFPAKIKFDISRNQSQDQVEKSTQTNNSSGKAVFSNPDLIIQSHQRTLNSSQSPLQSILELPKSTQPAPVHAPIQNYVPPTTTIIVTHEKVVYKDRVVYVPKYVYVPYEKLVPDPVNVFHDRVVTVPVPSPSVPNPIGPDRVTNSSKPPQPSQNNPSQGEGEGAKDGKSSPAGIASTLGIASPLLLDWILLAITLVTALVAIRRKIVNLIISRNRKVQEM